MVAETTPEVVFHMAAQIDVRRSVADPMFDMQTNVGGTINVLEAARGAGVRRVVNTSTGGAIYGEGKIIPAPEDHPVAPESPYGLSKFCAEGYCDLYQRMHGVSTVSLRYGNVYGPRQDPLGEAGVVAIFCGLRLRRRAARPCSATASRPATTSTWATWSPPTWPPPRPAPPGSINIGTGVESTVLDIVAASPRTATAASRPSWPPSGWARCGTARIDPARARGRAGVAAPRRPRGRARAHAGLPALAAYSTSGRCSSSVAEP